MTVGGILVETVPECCGKPCRPYRKVYGWTKEWGPTVEEGFWCKRCGRKRVPFHDRSFPTIRETLSDEQWAVYQANLMEEALNA